MCHSCTRGIARLHSRRIGEHALSLRDVPANCKLSAIYDNSIASICRTCAVHKRSRPFAINCRPPAISCSLTIRLSKFESPRRDLVSYRRGERHEVELARDLPVGSRMGFGCDARQRKKLQSQCAMATGSYKSLATLFLASRHSIGAARLTPSGPCGYSCPRDQTGAAGGG